MSESVCFNLMRTVCEIKSQVYAPFNSYKVIESLTTWPLGKSVTVQLAPEN